MRITTIPFSYSCAKDLKSLMIQGLRRVSKREVTTVVTVLLSGLRGNQDSGAKVSPFPVEATKSTASQLPWPPLPSKGWLVTWGVNEFSNLVHPSREVFQTFKCKHHDRAGNIQLLLLPDIVYCVPTIYCLPKEDFQQRRSSWNPAGPQRIFPGQALPHILCSSSSLKHLDNSIWYTFPELFCRCEKPFPLQQTEDVNYWAHSPRPPGT